MAKFVDLDALKHYNDKIQDQLAVLSDKNLIKVATTIESQGEIGSGQIDVGSGEQFVDADGNGYSLGLIPNEVYDIIYTYSGTDYKLVGTAVEMENGCIYLGVGSTPETLANFVLFHEDVVNHFMVVDKCSNVASSPYSENESSCALLGTDYVFSITVKSITKHKNIDLSFIKKSTNSDGTFGYSFIDTLENSLAVALVQSENGDLKSSNDVIMSGAEQMSGLMLSENQVGLVCQEPGYGSGVEITPTTVTLNVSETSLKLDQTNLTINDKQVATVDQIPSNVLYKHNISLNGTNTDNAQITARLIGISRSNVLASTYGQVINMITGAVNYPANGYVYNQDGSLLGTIIYVDYNMGNYFEFTVVTGSNIEIVQLTTAQVIISDTIAQIE